MKQSVPDAWAGVDVGKGHHWVCLVDEAGTTVWSSKVVNDEAAILEAIGGVLFYLYGERQLRAQQGYLVKFPAELFDVLPGLGAARSEEPTDPDEGLTEESVQPKQPAPTGKVTRVHDPQLRSAIENHAVEQAIEYYKELGGGEFVKLGKPYDLI